MAVVKIRHSAELGEHLLTLVVKFMLKDFEERFCKRPRKWHDNSEKCTYVLDDMDSLEHWCVYIIQGAAKNLCDTLPSIVTKQCTKAIGFD